MRVAGCPQCGSRCFVGCSVDGGRWGEDGPRCTVWRVQCTRVAYSRGFLGQDNVLMVAPIEALAVAVWRSIEGPCVLRFHQLSDGVGYV